MATFSEVFEDVTRQGRKLQTSEYKEQGKYVIIDQGQNDIAGYTNETTGLFTDVPAIVFGDHTRVLKYVDTPCFLGADGVKLLKAKIENPNYKFLFYALSHADIPNTGYNRHFKWLKEININLPSEQRQHEIVVVLDKVSDLIFLRKQQLTKLDELVKARFVEMFDSDPWDTVRAGSIMFDMRNGISPSNKGSHPAKVLTLSAFTQGAFDAEAWKDGLFDSEPPKEKRVVSSDFYMCRGNGNKNLVGAGVYSIEDRYDLIFPDTVIAASVDQQRVCLPYLFQVWKQPSVRKQIEQGARTTNGTYKINQGVVANIEIKLPPRELQQQFAAFTEQTDRSKLAVQRSLDKLEILKKSLMQKYFG